ncbi:MAG TPA: tetratricopeptide repeat protein [Haliangiales bacterium]|nr:tetratricopeptide repeat protein [Haliangiales bacterium]
MSARGILVNFCIVSCSAAALAEPRAIDPPDVPAKLPTAFAAPAFENRSGAGGLDWLTVALPFALAEKLEAHPGLRSLGGPLEVADGDAGAALVFRGSFSRPNWRLEIKLTLARNGQIVGEETRRGDFSECFEMLEDAAGALLAKAGEPVPEAALAAFRRRPTRDFYAFTLFGRGLLALTGKDAEAQASVKSLERAVFIDPRLAEAHRALGVAWEKLGQPGKARGQLAYALDLKPDSYWPIALLARAARAAKDRDEAMNLAAKALALRPWDHDMRYLLGEMLWEEGDEARAQRELERVTAAAPDHLPARRILVLVHASKGDLDKLAAELTRIVELDPEDVDARVDLGAADAALGREEDAIAAYRAVLAAHPRHLQALKLLGDLHRRRGELADAIACYERAVKANRADPRAYFLLGSAYTSAGQTDKALRIYLQAQRFPRYLPETYSNLGALYYQKGANEEALWYLRAAATSRPDNPRIHYNYGLALARAHARDRALGEFLRAVELAPDDAEMHFALGVAYLRLGRVEDAEKAFGEAVRLDPEHEGARQNLKVLDELRRKATDGEVRIE